MRTDDDLWGGLNTGWSLVTGNGWLQLQELVRPFQPGGRAAFQWSLPGIFQRVESEIVFLNREYDLTTRSRKLRLRSRQQADGNVPMRWIWSMMIWLCKIDGDLWLYGFAREGQNNVEGTVYGFEWRNGRFITNKVIFPGSVPFGQPLCSGPSFKPRVHGLSPWLSSHQEMTVRNHQ